MEGAKQQRRQRIIMLQTVNLTKDFGKVRAVEDVSLSIPHGQMVGIIGRSGAGKSTLLRLINRLIQPSRGRIVFDGKDIGALGGEELLEWRAKCAMIFQQFNLVNRLDVITNVLIGRLRYHNVWPTLFKRFPVNERAMAIRALERLEMDGCALQRADRLSGGQQQRVAIAKALVQQPEVLLADEPIASLDPRNAARVMEALVSINKEYGITVICNLHHLNTARTYCERIIGMAEGRIAFDGSPQDLTMEKACGIYGMDAAEDSLDGSLDAEEVELYSRAAVA